MRHAASGYLYAFLLYASLQSSVVRAQVQTDPESRLVEITSKTSLAQVSAGADFGISIDIKNKSKVPLYFQGQWVTLVLPPELDVSSPTGWYGFFTLPELTEQEVKAKVGFWARTVALAPGDSTSVFWARMGRKTEEPDKLGGSDESKLSKPGGTDESRTSVWRATWRSTQDYLDRKLKELAFSPGDYTVKFIVVYWTNKDNVGKILKNSRSTILDVKVPVVAPQWVIIFGAIIGGLISYVLLPKVRLHESKYYFPGLLTSALLSVIVTILLARISETQFLIRISVNDIWGAIAVGFIAGASGTSILKRWIPDGDANKKDGKKPPATTQES